jgi:hypothetical protein
MAEFKKTIMAELIELGDAEDTGSPTAIFQWNDEGDDLDHLAKIELPEDDLRAIAPAFYRRVRITIEYDPNEDEQ